MVHALYNVQNIAYFVQWIYVFILCLMDSLCEKALQPLIRPTSARTNPTEFTAATHAIWMRPFGFFGLFVDATAATPRISPAIRANVTFSSPFNGPG